MGQKSWVARLQATVRGRLFQNISWLSLSYALAKPLWFAFITAGCMRMLTPEGYGMFTTSLALVMMTSAASDFGTAEYTTREVARLPSVASRLFTNILLGRLGLALVGVGVAVGLGISLAYPPDHLGAVLAASVYVLLFRGAEYCRAVFRAFERLKHEAAFTVLEKGAVVAVGFTLLAAFRTSAMAFAGMAIGMAAVFIASVWWVDRHFASFRLRLWRPSYLAGVLRRAAPLGFIAVFSAVPLQATPILVDAVLGTEAAGFYGAAQRIVEAMMLLTSVVVAAVFARLSALYYRGDRAAYRRLLGQVVLSMTFITLGIGATISVVATRLVTFLAGGSGYAEAGMVLAALSWLFPLMNATALSVIALIAADAHRFAMWSTGIAALLSVVLTYAFLPSLGLYAPVGGLGLTYLFLAFFNLRRCWQMVAGSALSPT